MTDFKGFKGAAKRIEDMDLPRVGIEIGVGEDIIHGIIDTEAAGSGFDSQGRPKMLFEPHVFYRNLTGAKRDRAVQEGLAYAKWRKGKYPKDSYPRLTKAVAIDETAALKAASWGLGQVLGENFTAAGFETPQEMVLAAMEDEDNHLEMMISFIKNNGLDDELRVLERTIKKRPLTPDDCRAFVRGYNGAGYATHDYHGRFARNVNKWLKIKDTPYDPDVVIDATNQVDVAAVPPSVSEDIYDGQVHERVKAVQELLDSKGYPEVGSVDGRWGTKSRAAVLAFRADAGLPIVPTIDDEMLAALVLWKGRPVAPERANATVADLREKEVPEIEQADQTQIVGTAVAGTGVITAVTKAVEQFEGYGGIVKRVSDTLEPIQGFLVDNLWIIAIAGGAYVIHKSGVLKKLRVLKHQTGEDVSR